MLSQARQRPRRANLGLVPGPGCGSLRRGYLDQGEMRRL